MSSIPSASSALSARLLCRMRQGVTLTFNLKGEESIVGREAGMAVAVPTEGVSRQHARIIWDGRNYWIEDLKSTNGTYLNGQRLVRERLRHLDVITLGKKVDLLFVLGSETQTASKRQGIVGVSLTSDSPESPPHEIPLGEVTVGRSPACNIIVDSGAVSKVHARLERTTDQLTLQDLGSSNGTFVNGERATTAVLQDNDVISFAGVETYRVVIRMGEVPSSSGVRAAPRSGLEPSGVRPRFSAEWKTRFEWDSGEREAIAALQAEVRQKGGLTADLKPKTPPRASPKPAPKPELRPVSAGPPAAPKPPLPRAPTPATPKAPDAPVPPVVAPPSAARPVAAKPAPPVASGPSTASAPPSSQPSSEVAGARAASAPPSGLRPIEAKPTPLAVPVPSKGPTSPPPPAKAANASVKAVPPAPRAPTPPVPVGKLAPPAPARVQSPQQILEVRLTGSGFDVAASTTGAHDLGRAKEASLRVDHPTVSRRHARIIISDDRTMVYVQDVGGMNGTRVNGRVIERLETLSPGDVVGMGDLQLSVFFKRD
jgi:pSer/pThr/pTyr-binding forkhead associated (FHA) protein